MLLVGAKAYLWKIFHGFVVNTLAFSARFFVAGKSHFYPAE